MCYMDLGKEVIKEVSKTWGNLVYLNSNLIKDEQIKSIGRGLYKNKNILNDYLYYKYEWSDEQDTLEKAKLWMAEWWYDERGPKYQKETFIELVNLILDEIEWVYDEDNDLYMPKGYHYSRELKTLAFDCNPDVVIGI